MSDARDTPRPTVLLQVAAVEALAASGRSFFTEDELASVLSWLAEPARGETVRALLHHGWIEPGPAGTRTLTEAGRQAWKSVRRAAFAEAWQPPAGLTPERIVRALLSCGLEELAAAGRDALVPVLAPPPLLITEAVVRAAETHALRGARPTRRPPLSGGGDS